MEEEILRAQTSNESVWDIATAPWIRIIRQVAWQCSTVLHLWHSSTFQLLLTEQSRNLRLINDTTFSTSQTHRRNVILGEAFDQAPWNAFTDDGWGSFTHTSLDNTVNFLLKVFLILCGGLTNLLLEASPNWVIRLDATLITRERVPRDDHLVVLVNVLVEVLLRLKHNSVRVVKLLNIVLWHVSELGGFNHTVHVSFFNEHSALQIAFLV